MSFDLAGANLTETQQEIVFQRIYSRFGSQACYEMFHDALPFLHWLERRNVVCGVLSNADERYGTIDVENVIDRHLDGSCHLTLQHFCFFSPLFC